ncbi:MAG: hypothetical protein HQM04_06500 [Magnetococcales bacterium]|nr:hypothetical protein [Magnetococcales bacterium]MBF0114677.1 hypothetical protein [Magnetococcales bacterium]
MAVKEQNLSIIAGDTTTYTVRIKAFGAPVDISGHLLLMTIKRSTDDTDEQAVVRKRVVIPADNQAKNGLGVLVLQSVDTCDVEPGNYRYDVKKVIPGTLPDVTTILRGNFSIERSITRSVI